MKPRRMRCVWSRGAPDGACTTCRRYSYIMHTKFWLENLKGRDLLRHLGRYIYIYIFSLSLSLSLSLTHTHTHTGYVLWCTLFIYKQQDQNIIALNTLRFTFASGGVGLQCLYQCSCDVRTSCIVYGGSRVGFVGKQMTVVRILHWPFNSYFLCSIELDLREVAMRVWPVFTWHVTGTSGELLWAW